MFYIVLNLSNICTCMFVTGTCSLSCDPYLRAVLICDVPQRGHKISTYYQRYLLSGLVYVHEVYTGTE